MVGEEDQDGWMKGKRCHYFNCIPTDVRMYVRMMKCPIESFWYRVSAVISLPAQIMLPLYDYQEEHHLNHAWEPLLVLIRTLQLSRIHLQFTKHKQASHTAPH